MVYLRIHENEYHIVLYTYIFYNVDELMYREEFMNIICFGDSITRGYDVREGLGWVELCSAALPAYHMENHGIDGLSVQGLINYLESWCIDKPYEDDRYICIMCGTNDILQNRDSDYVYNKLIIGLETQIDSEMDGLNHVVVDVNRRLQDYAREHNLKTIDFYTVLHEADQIGQIVFAGEVHPNERGYRLMAYKALETFTRL